MFSRKTRRFMAMEQLESRHLMAGNVTADLVAGSLVLTGDGQDNGVEIVPVVAAGRVQQGTFTIRGRDWNGPTTVNGQSEVLFRFVNDDIRVNLAGGRDFFVMGSTAGSLRITDDLIIDTGDGSDLMFLYDVDVGGRAQITTGAGEDAVYLNEVTVREVSSFIELVISTGSDSDFVNAAQLSVTGDTYVDSGGDTFSDNVWITQSGISGDVWILTGGGDDRVRILEFSCDDLTINTGEGSDQAELNYASVDLLFADLGNGDQDYLSIARSGGRRATVNGGGGGGDRFDFYNEVQFESISESGFEVIVT